MTDPTLSEAMREEADNLPYDALDKFIVKALLFGTGWFCGAGFVVLLSKGLA